MSIGFCPVKKILACDLFDGRLEEFNVREDIRRQTTEHERCLTDGCNYLWVFIGDDGFVSNFHRWMPNGDPEKILKAIAEVFDTNIVSEYEPQYWGFETQEEWDACMERMSREYEEKFHVELLKYCRGEPNDIEPGTNGELDAEIAKKLSDKDPSLLLPENKNKLASQIEFLRPQTWCSSPTKWA
jgi:hypothetical protein